MSKDKDELIKLAHRVVDVMDRPNRKICVTMLQYNVDKPECSYAQVQKFANEDAEEKFQQIVYANYKLDEFINLLDLKNSVNDKFFANQSICIVLWEKFKTT